MVFERMRSDGKYGKMSDRPTPMLSKDIREVLPKGWVNKRSEFSQMVILAARSHRELIRGEMMYDKEAILYDPIFGIGKIGERMEVEKALLESVNDEAEESLKILRNLYNEVLITSDQIEPELVALVKRIRTMRQTVSMELKQALSIMRDVRKFFLEDDYKSEIERLEQFVALGKELKELVKDGTMEAVTSMALKLMLKEEGEQENGED